MKYELVRKANNNFFDKLNLSRKRNKQLTKFRKKKKIVSTSQGHSGLVTVWMGVLQGRVVLLMSMIRNEDDGVSETEKEKFTNDYFM